MRVSSKVSPARSVSTVSACRALHTLAALACFVLASCSSGGSNNNPPPPDTTPPTAPSGLAATVAAGPSSATGINLAWTASTDNVGVTSYQVFRCQGASCSAFASIGSAMTTSFNDSGLAPSTSYSYQVLARDAAGNNSAFSATATASTTADTTPPIAPTALTAMAQSPTQINLSWTASTDNVGVTGYQIQRCQGAGCSNFAQIGVTTTATTFNDTTVAASTSYSYRVSAKDAAGNTSGFSTTASATTPATPDNTPPTAPSGLTANANSGTQINLSWTASTDNVGVTGYQIQRCQGAACANFTQIGTTTAATTFNDTTAVNATSYSYRVSAKDAANNVSGFSNTASATTPDTAPPTAPSNLTATAASATQINLSWTASTDNVGVTGYQIQRCQGPNCSNFANLGAPVTTTTFNDTTVVEATSYSYRVSAKDAANNVSGFSNTASATTPDITPPTAPSGLTATAVSGTQINLSWSASTDNVGVTGYQIQRCQGAACSNFANLGVPVTTATFNDTTVVNATPYRYQVFARDAAGNTSPASNIASATTPDTAPPTAPSGLTANAISGTQINLSWTASTDNVGVTSYQIQRCQGPNCSNFANLGAPVTTTSFNDTTVVNATSYSYRVSAKDAANNVSGFSNTATALTPDTAPPTAPTNLTATAASSSQINLSWMAATDNVGVTGYQIQRCQGAACSNFAQVGTTTGATTFNDTGLAASTPYSYQVSAKDAANNVSGFSNIASATTQVASSITVAVSPRRSSVTTSQAQQFSATVSGSPNTNVTWEIDGTAGGNANSLGTIDATGKYTPPTSGTIPGTHVVAARSAADTTVTGTASIAVTDLAAVFTYQNDNQRTGQNQQEYALTPSVVSAANFGKRFTCDTTEGNTVPGHVYGQPLYVANLAIGGGTHNVFFVVTESDWVYAFDADGGANGTTCVQYWKASMLTTAHGAILGETTVPAADTGETGDLIPEIGITSTPVIDSATSTLYLTSKSKESNTAYHHRLHALDLATGAEKLGGPKEITATAPGTGFVFDPLIHMQRPALLLSGNNIYLGFGSHGDQANYHGWLLGYNKTTLAQSSVWVATDTSAAGTLGAIWQAGAGPAVDSNGNIWVEIANGDFDTGTPRVNFGDSVVKLNPTGTTVLDFFTPNNQDALRAADTDLGSAGVTILPDGFGNATHLHLAVATGKPNILYLLDQASLGQFQSTPPDNAIQELTLPNGPFNGVIGGMFSKPAYFNGRIYVVPINDVFQAYSISNAHMAALIPVGTDTFGFPGATPAVSSQGASTNGIVWMLNTNNNNSGNGSGASGPAVLFAYDAATLNKLYSSPASAGAGAAVNAVKFVVPTIANGKVYVAGQGGVTVFGLLP